MEYTGERYIPGVLGQIELEHLNRYYFVINQVDLSEHVVLDIASGEGYGSDLLSKYSKQVIGIDISIEAIEHSKKKYTGKNLDFLVGNITNIPLPDHSIDIVVSFETIEHHNKHTEMLNEIKRILKPEGYLFISSPDKYFYSDLPHFRNEFHIKELYFEEFRKLICDNFRSAKFFNQKFFCGSIILLDESDCKKYSEIVIDSTGTVSRFTPVYNISVATNNPNLILNHHFIGFTNGSEDLISRKYFEDTLNKIYCSWTWRIGRIFVKPVKIIASLIKK